MTQEENLLDKYYKGETSIEEEKKLKELIKAEEMPISETDIFSFYENEAHVPEDLEDDIFKEIEPKLQPKRTIRMRLYSVISAAAVVLILLTVYLDFRKEQRAKMEDNFFVMERALFQVSESLQAPQGEDEMLILWVDDDVEIILN